MKRIWMKWIALSCIGIIAIFTFIACGGSEDDDDLVAYTVLYEIIGTAATVDVTLQNQDGGTSQFSDVALPWQYGPFAAEEGDFVYVSAQNQGRTGSVTVKILVDNNLFKTSTSQGEFVIATASEIL